MPDTATLPRMGKKKSPEQPTPSKQPTDVVRVEADLARMLAIISTATGESISDIISPILRPLVSRRYEEVVRQLGEEVKKGKKSEQ